MEIYDKIYRNVKALAQIRGVKLGDVEAAIKRNPGFLSRRPKISIDQMIDIAKLLNVGCDDLINKDYQRDLDANEAMHNLDAVVWNAKRYFDKDIIMKFVENVLKRESE